jgi:hypothetical protein
MGQCHHCTDKSLVTAIGIVNLQEAAVELDHVHRNAAKL